MEKSEYRQCLVISSHFELELELELELILRLLELELGLDGSKQGRSSDSDGAVEHVTLAEPSGVHLTTGKQAEPSIEELLEELLGGQPWQHPHCFLPIYGPPQISCFVWSYSERDIHLVLELLLTSCENTHPLFMIKLSIYPLNPSPIFMIDLKGFGFVLEVVRLR